MRNQSANAGTLPLGNISGAALARRMRAPDRALTNIGRHGPKLDQGLRYWGNFGRTTVGPLRARSNPNSANIGVMLNESGSSSTDAGVTFTKSRPGVGELGAMSISVCPDSAEVSWGQINEFRRLTGLFGRTWGDRPNLRQEHQVRASCRSNSGRI